MNDNGDVNMELKVNGEGVIGRLMPLYIEFHF